MTKRFLILYIFAGFACAQSGEFWLGAGTSILANTNIGTPVPDGQPDDTTLGNGFRLNFRYTFNTSGHFGHELQYAYNRTTFTDNTGAILSDTSSVGTAIHQFGYNLLYYTRATSEDQKLRPFFTGGFHLSDFVLPGSGIPQGSSVKPGGNIGGGVKIRLSPLFAVRFDAREYLTGKPGWGGLLTNRGGLLYQTEISAAFGVLF
ncbi:MAG: outer membrane beta-barrel protein [Bryobacterales bacterium]|nr:outer membrane beta-barrel protein [Bryobacterales bacterium]MBV9398775.1 outer membrane beta-barrel protein [Bryobacterales bacterium]